MKPTKAFILKIRDPISEKYAEVAADSCDAIGLKWQYFNGYQNMSGIDAWGLTGVKMKWIPPVRPEIIADPSDAQKAHCCSASHGEIWRLIAEGKDEAVIVLEHDAIMLHPVDIDIPENEIVALGYKITDPEKYDHVRAGPPEKLVAINGHHGAHAYAITKKTAQFLVNEIEAFGILGAVDNAYFMQGQRRTAAKLSITSPIAALGWLRESTIWSRGSAIANYEFLESFSNYYKYNGRRTKH